MILLRTKLRNNFHFRNNSPLIFCIRLPTVANFRHTKIYPVSAALKFKRYQFLIIRQGEDQAAIKVHTEAFYEFIQMQYLRHIS